MCILLNCTKLRYNYNKNDANCIVDFVVTLKLKTCFEHIFINFEL